jgi:alkylation response protein AidB-like acyl-CoA dehydrogenase
VVYCGLPILKFGTEAQKHQLLPKIANGELIMTLALTEPSARYDAAEVACQAVPDGDGYILSGTKLFVPDAHIADQLLCAARTSEGVEEGITLFLIDAKSPGISCTVLKTFSADKLCEVAFANVPVPRGNILGELDHGWNIVKSIAEHAAVAHCALMLGMVEWVLQASVDYAKERVQFGRPIGALQAVQHKCADMVIDVDGCRFITYQAAWKLSQGLPCTLEVSMAKAWVGEASRRVCIQGHQIHGGIGFTADHDIQLYSRRAMAGELAFGDSDFHREIVAQQLGF